MRLYRVPRPHSFFCCWLAHWRSSLEIGTLPVMSWRGPSWAPRQDLWRANSGLDTTRLIISAAIKRTRSHRHQPNTKQLWEKARACERFNDDLSALLAAKSSKLRAGACDRGIIQFAMSAN